MPYIPIDKIADTMISWIENQRPVYDSLIDAAYHERRLNIFLGRRKTIGAASLPSLEVQGTSEALGWHAVRVQQTEPTVEIDITVDNRHPEEASRLQAKLVSLTVRIFNDPIHILPTIINTPIHLFDSLVSNVVYQPATDGTICIATITWQGKYLSYLLNRNFPLDLQVFPDPQFP